MSNNNNALFNSPKLSKSKTAQERYKELDEKVLTDFIGQEPELPLPEEVIKARKKKAKEMGNLQSDYPDIASTSTPLPGLCAEHFMLPSKNLLYGENFDGQFTMRMFTTKEERIRLSSKEDYMQTMAAMLNNCITTSNGVKIDTKLFTEFDFIYTMYKARIISYGPLYDMVIKCPYCGETQKVTVNLDELEIDYLPDDFVEPFEVGPLPMSKDVLTLKFLRIIDRIEINKEAERIKAENPNYLGDTAYNASLEHRICTVNGKELSPYELKEYVDNLPSMDNQFIEYKLNKIEVGLNLFQKAKCCNSNCGMIMPFTLSMNSTFFRPRFDS